MSQIPQVISSDVGPSQDAAFADTLTPSSSSNATLSQNENRNRELERSISSTDSLEAIKYKCYMHNDRSSKGGTKGRYPPSEIPEAELDRLLKKHKKWQPRTVDTTDLEGVSHAEGMYKKSLERSRLQTARKTADRRRKKQEILQPKMPGYNTDSRVEQSSTQSISQSDSFPSTYSHGFNMRPDEQNTQGSSVTQWQNSQTDQVFLFDIGANGQWPQAHPMDGLMIDGMGQLENFQWQHNTGSYYTNQPGSGSDCLPQQDDRSIQSYHSSSGMPSSPYWAFNHQYAYPDYSFDGNTVPNQPGGPTSSVYPLQEGYTVHGYVGEEPPSNPYHKISGSQSGMPDELGERITDQTSSAAYQQPTWLESDLQGVSVGNDMSNFWMDPDGTYEPLTFEAEESRWNR